MRSLCSTGATDAAIFFFVAALVRGAEGGATFFAFGFAFGFIAVVGMLLIGRSKITQ
jgi:hypothetical protein